MKKTLQFLVALIAATLLFNTCRKKETAKAQPLVQEVVQEITIDSITNHHEDTTYQYEYRTGESGDYQYNYDVIATDVDENEFEGNINVEGKYGKGTITDLEGNEIEITTEWIGYGKLLGKDHDSNEYEILVKN
ncbi:hypothetical protein [Flavobacterium aquatile]|uniref:hypothetical protein n=1 Tax=Flavobacterium aquatile TaxID=245 RepID=UPI0006917A04|nr:hypothetical protein [Flavobacterium aquatile]OXA65700.1 hypothetical protein B0A61_13715 [Flavobacterium aquatile LMG 4008 = ATCC 11947]GEC78159.1 hypothetical protein FAQ01_10290 [Flavobacterium aquatile]